MLNNSIRNNPLTSCFSLQAIHIVAFAHIGVLSCISDVTSVAVATGVANTLGNKGGVCISLKFGRTSLAVVNAHLAPHHGAVNKRNEQLNKIDREMYVLLSKKNAAQTPSVKGAYNAGSSKISPDDLSVPASEPPKRLVEGEAEPNPPAHAAASETVQGNETVAGEGRRDAHTEIVALVNDGSGLAPGTTPVVSGTPTPASSVPVTAPTPRDRDKVMSLRKISDAVILMGDLNYRIRGNRCVCLHFIYSHFMPMSLITVHQRGRIFLS